jgi:hypothetical protein
VDVCVFLRECFGLWCVVLLSMLVFSLVVAVSTFGHRTTRRYNNTHCTYGVNLQHEGSISELHCAKSFFSRAREDRTICFAKNNTLRETTRVFVSHVSLERNGLVDFKQTSMDKQFFPFRVSFFLCATYHAPQPRHKTCGCGCDPEQRKDMSVSSLSPRPLTNMYFSHVT